MLKNIIVVLQLLIVIGCTNSEQISNAKIEGDYIDQRLPRNSAIVFAPEIVSGEFNVRDAAFSIEGDEFFFSLKGSSFYSIIQIKKINNVWEKPTVAKFSGKYSDIEPCFSNDGNKLYFVSNRPLNGIGEPKDYDIWYVEKTKNDWENPKNLGSPVNTLANEFYPSFTKDGTLYFCANYKDGIGGEDLYYSELKNGFYTLPINLGDSINTKKDEFNSFISADGGFIMFTSMGWGTGSGGGDLWISFRMENKLWSGAINMGQLVNTQYFEYSPSLTPDGKFMFFTSNRFEKNNYFSSSITYSQIIKERHSTLNGSQNIFWIKTDFIENLRK